MHSTPLRLGAAALFFLVLAAPGTAALPTNLTWNASLALKEGWDDNVYLQNVAPGPGSPPGALPAKKDSWVTTVTPRVGLDDQICSGFKASLAYAPDVAFYHNAPSENNTAHRGWATFSGAVGDAVWEQANAFTGIDGNRFGPIYGRPQDCPAIGAVPLRDRRDQFVYRGGFKLTWTLDPFFIRPVASAYYHDFQTVQEPNPAGGLYENYIDRQDVNGGLDVGYDIGKKTYFVLGYRYGRQDQFKLLGVDSPYDSSYHRILFGLEGSPWPWLKLAAFGGPEIRDWADGTPAGFDRNHPVYWVDAAVTLLPDKNDAVTLLYRRFEQPSFSGFAVYDDITYSAAWKHAFDEHWSASAGFQLYVGNYYAPVYRYDWIYTPTAALTYTLDKHFSAEAAFLGDWAKNKEPTSAPGASYANGREYTRHLVSLSVKYTF